MMWKLQVYLNIRKEWPEKNTDNQEKQEHSPISKELWHWDECDNLPIHFEVYLIENSRKTKYFY